MAYSAIEDKYLSALTAVQFPDAPVEPVMPEMAAPGEQPGDVLLAAGPSQTMTDAGGGGLPVDSIKPFDPTIRQRLSDFLQAGFEGLGMNRYKARQNAQSIIGGPSSNLPLSMGLADVVPFLGTTMQTEEAAIMGGEAVESAKQGNYGIAALQAGGAAIGMIPGAVGTVKGTKVAVKGAKATGKALAPKAGEMLGNYMQRTGLQSNLMAYHGTPHSFDKFDSKKIGSGEGAQAYGFGLYFAESKDVADSYRVRLGYDPAKMKVGGKQINEVYSSIENAAARMPAQKAQGEYEKLELLERLMMNDMPGDVLQAADQMSPATKAWFEKSVKPSFETYGTLYTVDVPDEVVAKMLDFDAPIGSQSQEIQALAKRYNLQSEDLGGDLLAAAKGKTAAGAQRLREAGIPGVRYLDQGSRQNQQSTRNIVVFPGGEEQIKILSQEGNK